MASARKGLSYLDTRPRGWDCTVQAGQFERGRAYEFFWELPLHGIIVYDGQEFLFDGELEAKVTMQRQGERVIADIGIRAQAEAPCSRCLEKTELALNHEFRYFYISSDEDEEEAADRDEHTVFVGEESTSLDISDQIWETLVMSFPEKVLCRADCKGICPVCGSNKNHEECSCEKSAIDPRLAVLADALEDEKRQNNGKGGTKHGSTQE
jgi:uncharacterized protein